jgi:hypothetical protein
MASAIWVQCIQQTHNHSFWTFGTHKLFAFWSATKSVGVPKKSLTNQYAYIQAVHKNFRDIN